MAVEGFMVDPGRYQAVQAAYQKFTLEHEALVLRSAQGSEPTVTAANALVGEVAELRKSLQKASKPVFEDYLRGEKSFFPFAYRLSQLIAMPIIQCDDLLKLSMSRAVHGLLDLAVVQCDLQERRIYEETVKEIKDNLRNVIKTVPDSQGETEINLKFAHAASKKLEEGKGKWRTIISNRGMEIADGLAQVLLSVSPLPPFISLGPLAPPVMHLIADIYNAREEQWYAQISKVMWYSDLGKIDNLEGYLELKPGLVMPSENYKFAFFLTDLFGRMLKGAHLDPNLRDEIVNGQEVSLVALFDRNINVKNVLDWRNKRKFWRVRYNCLKHLEGAAVCNPALTAKILKRVYQEEEKQIVRDLAMTVIANVCVANVQAVNALKEAVPEIEASLAEQKASLGEQTDELEESRAHVRRKKKRYQQLKHEMQQRNSVDASAGPQQHAGSDRTLKDEFVDAIGELIAQEKLLQSRESIPARENDLSALREAIKSGDWTTFRNAKTG